MHGVLHRELKEYVEERTDEDWEALRDRAGIEPKLYLPVSHYPDEEFEAVVDTLVEASGEQRRAVLNSFGAYLAPTLLETFRSHIREGWGLLDLLEHLEDIYDRIGGQNEETTPPTVHCDRVVSDMAVLTYRSDRELCWLAEGLLAGVADEYDAEVTIEQEQCLHEGDDRCEFTVERA
jgi:predicted hydrocarbon binding protein